MSVMRKKAGEGNHALDGAFRKDIYICISYMRLSVLGFQGRHGLTAGVGCWQPRQKQAGLPGFSLRWERGKVEGLTDGIQLQGSIRARCNPNWLHSNCAKHRSAVCMIAFASD